MVTTREGYWGPQTSPLNYCEHDYTTSYYGNVIDDDNDEEEEGEEVMMSPCCRCSDNSLSS